MSDGVFVIVGAGQAGGWIVKTLRAEGFDGQIVLIGAEQHPPYQRPPLSKNLLRDAAAIAETALLSLEDLASADVQVRLGERVDRIDRPAQAIHCSSGLRIRYDRLFLTTGSRPRIPDWLAGTKSDRMHLLRTIDDAATLRDALSGASSLLIVVAVAGSVLKLRRARVGSAFALRAGGRAAPLPTIGSGTGVELAEAIAREPRR